MNQSNEELRALLALCLGALTVLAPKDNDRLTGLIRCIEDALFETPLPPSGQK